MPPPKRFTLRADGWSEYQIPLAKSKGNSRIYRVAVRHMGAQDRSRKFLLLGWRAADTCSWQHMTARQQLF
jgi:hypothetical protein